MTVQQRSGSLPASRNFKRCGFLLALILAASAIQAETPKSRDAALQQLLQKAQGTLRQLAQDKAALEAEKAALEEQVKMQDERIKQLEPLQAEVAARKAEVASLKTANAGLENQLAQARQRESALQRQQQDIIGKARQIQAENGRLRTHNGKLTADNQLLYHAVSEREQWIGQCGERNRKLVDANHELVGKYEDKGFWDKVGELEPFTGIGKVATETTAQDYRYKLQHLQVTPFKGEAKPEAEPVPAAEIEEAPESEVKDAQ